jgi:hypothetical protein
MIRGSVQSEEAFRAAGFSPPQTVWAKTDPRGSEYGRYEVFINDGRCDWPKITVSYYVKKDDIPPVYVMYFDSFDHFTAWAKHVV